MDSFSKALAREFGKDERHIQNVIDLIDAGNTIPFIARYRKEMHGAMDDQLLREIADRLGYLRSLEKRKNEVRESIAEQDKLTDEVSSALDAALTLAEVEDIYRPFRPKRRTRAAIAKERGLEPLCELILSGCGDLLSRCDSFIDAEKGVATREDALAGARDIIAERLSDDAEIRKKLRALGMGSGEITSKAAVDEDSVYRDYYEFSQPVKKVPGHRVLALNRGEREGFLKVGITVPEGEALAILEASVVKNDGSECDRQLKEACLDSFERLIFPSVERELRSALTESADEQAIKTFSLNLKPLLMQPPIKNKVTLGFDPAYRTGCKLAVVDGTGKVLDTAVIYPTPPNNKKAESSEKLRALIDKYHIEVISLGNGTASRESEQFIAETIKGTGVGYVIVSEAGASVYSASKLAAQEFPQYDVSLRSAVSIARRLQDPLAELVKIDPKSIGVGQYQHDMPPARLSEALDGAVEDCVNAVGADVNTASPSLLSHIAGIGPALAKNIVAYREENGAFTSRKQLLKVPKLGSKAFVQCAGFLRVPESEQPLDNTGVHPESYDAAQKLLSLCGCDVSELRSGGAAELEQRAQKLGASSLADSCGVGVPTLRDIIKELVKPGRDPRDELPAPVLRSDVLSLDDLVPGMELTGTVRNVVDFGAFVDVGVHEDGLVHISKLSTRFVRHPSDVVRTGDVVKVWVVDVDAAKKRISLSMVAPREGVPDRARAGGAGKAAERTGRGS